MNDSIIRWDHVILSALRTGFETDLPEIYDIIDKMRIDGSFIIKPELFEIEPRWGARPRYHHTVRGIVSSLRKRGMVNRVERSSYQITDLGRELLKELDY